jgi:DNA-directed RNA polymerase specialized sigma24 family protein
MPEFDDVFNDIGEQDLPVLHLQMGFPDAFKVLFFQYYPEILSFAVMCLRDQDHLVARNVTLEAFFLLWERHSDFDTEKRIKAFLYLAVRNKCLHNLPSGARIDLPPVTPPSSLPPDLLRDIFDYTDRPNFFAY